MKKSVIAICIVFILFSFGAFLLFKSSVGRALDF